MKIKLKSEYLEAALLCAANDDIRSHLNGVYLKISAQEVLYAGTTGHFLFAASHKIEGELSEPIEIVVPYTTVKYALSQHRAEHKSQSKNIEILLEEFGDKFALGYQLFSPIVGEYPDIKKVLPEKCSGKTAQYNPQYVSTLSKAVVKAGRYLSHEFYLHHNGDGAAVLCGKDPKIIGLIMPWRGYEPCEWEFNP